MPAAWHDWCTAGRLVVILGPIFGSGLRGGTTAPTLRENWDNTPGPVLTVIIVSWNTSGLLRRCLTSLRRELADFILDTSLIVVDNASADDSVSMVEQEFPDVRNIALAENIGYAGGANLGMRSTSSDIVLICNPDLEFLPGSVARLWSALHAASHIGMVAPLLVNSDGSIQSAGYRFPGAAQSIFDLLPLPDRLMTSALNGRIGPGDGSSPIAIDHPLGACLMVRRAVIEQTGGMDAGYFMYSEEIDWCRRIKQLGWTILLAPAARVIHHGGQSTSQVVEEMFLQLHRSRARYLRRYEPDWKLAATQLAGRLAATRATLRHEPERASVLNAVASLYRGRSDDREDADA
ncbi:MAG TPA: glycosyltransferase family 2 protein [Thermomicrobiaceae bacterium]|nr:glycosyltransferase family 2 protein [Thermomicrobiaceae bacterium]